MLVFFKNNKGFAISIKEVSLEAPSHRLTAGQCLFVIQLFLLSCHFPPLFLIPRIETTEYSVCRCRLVADPQEFVNTTRRHSSHSSVSSIARSHSRKRTSGNGDGQRKRSISLLNGLVPALLQSNRQQEVRIPFSLFLFFDRVQGLLFCILTLGLGNQYNAGFRCKSWHLLVNTVLLNSSCCVGYFRMLLRM
jgi:hypothetical protein